MSNQSQFSQKYVDVLKMCKNIELKNVAYINNDDDIDDDDDDDDDDDQNALILKLQIATDLFVYCICLFMCLCMRLCMFLCIVVCLPWWIVHGGASGLFWQTGGAGRDFKSIKCLLELTLCGIWLELKLVYVCGHGSKLSQDLTAHPLSNCLAFVIWLWQWHESTLSLPLSMLQPWGIKNWFSDTWTHVWRLNQNPNTYIDTCHESYCSGQDMCLKTVLTSVKRQMFTDVKMDTWMADKCGNWTVQNHRKKYLQNNVKTQPLNPKLSLKKRKCYWQLFI